MRKVHASICICCDYKKLVAFFWDISKWSSFWSPIHDVEVLYDDGKNQEFSMKVDWQNDVHRIRTIRFIEHSKIVFFSPTPPPPTVIHHGTWSFTSNPQQEIEVRAERFFCLPSYFTPMETSKFMTTFENRLNKILLGAKRLCEK